MRKETRVIQNPTAFFALTRGYHGLHKVRYRHLIRRCLKLKKFINKEKGVSVLFHEGNISKPDQFFLTVLTFTKHRFVNVEKEFELPEGFTWTGSKKSPIGYALMCRFHYLGLWKYLDKFDVVCRVDEDCFVANLPSFSEIENFATGAFCEETHVDTNIELPKFLNTLGHVGGYDHVFPYTNCYITRTDFWLQEHVQEFLSSIAGNRNSLEWRWGDLPVIGVALNVFGGWGTKREPNKEIDYFHGSHVVSVKNGIVSNE